MLKQEIPSALLVEFFVDKEYEICILCAKCTKAV